MCAMDERSAEWNFHFGQMLLKRNDYEKAVVYLKIAVRQAPQNEEYKRSLEKSETLYNKKRLGGVLKKLRENGNDIPVLILTARSEVDDKVLGLDSGANYYLTKPFDTKELLATIRAITRGSAGGGAKLVFGNLSLDRSTFELSSPTGSFRLANKEFQLMELLMLNPHQVISTEKLMEKIWGFDSEAEINVVWVYVSYLRKKLSALGSSVSIKASRNVGYTLEENK